MAGTSLNARSLRWMYRDGHPNRVAAVMNSAWAWVGKLGLWPNRLITLEVPGRRSGKLTSNPLVVADLGDESYLVSMLGKKADWVANVRAAGGRAVIRYGRREQVELREVPIEERAPIIQRYLEVAPGGRPHIPVALGAPREEFERIAADYPVFRIVRGG